MQEGDDSVASLREMANRCRLLAASITDATAAASLRKLAFQYGEAADAAEQQKGLHWNGPPSSADCA